MLCSGLKIEGYQGPHCCQPHHLGGEAGGGGLSVRVGLRQREEQPYALTLRNL